MKKLIVLLLTFVLLLTAVACSSQPDTLEEAVEMADELVSKWNDEALNNCEYNGEYTDDVQTYIVGATVLSTSDLSEYAKISRAKTVCEDVYKELSSLFENYSDVVIYVIVEDENHSTYYVEKDGETFDYTQLFE